MNEVRMIELRDLTERERVNISIQCEPFFLVSKQTKQFTSIYKHLMKNFQKKYSKEVWLLITSFVKAVKYGNNGTRFSLSQGSFVTANRIHKQKLSLNRVKYVISKLDDDGYLIFYKGYYFNEEFNMTTCLLMTDKFKDLIDVDVARRFGLKRDPIHYIEVKDKDDKRILLSIKDFRGYTSLTKFMDKYNTLLSRNVIMMPDEETGEMLKCSVVYKRVFSGDLESAGRFYEMGKFQVKKSEFRKCMTINNEAVTEVDLSNLHPRLLYTLEGVVLDAKWDAYKIDCLDWVVNGKSNLRSFLKAAYLSVLFSESKDEAAKSILHKANKDKNINIHNLPEAIDVVNAVLGKNTPIQHYFFKDRLWAKLQGMDGRLAAYVIGKHTDEGIVCLGWHDSFVVPRDKQVFLINTMREAWYSLLGTYDNFKYDIEF
jgi:hypothetical protein